MWWPHLFLQVKCHLQCHKLLQLDTNKPVLNCQCSLCPNGQDCWYDYIRITQSQPPCVIHSIWCRGMIGSLNEYNLHTNHLFPNYPWCVPATHWGVGLSLCIHNWFQYGGWLSYGGRLDMSGHHIWLVPALHVHFSKRALI